MSSNIYVPLSTRQRNVLKYFVDKEKKDNAIIEIEQWISDASQVENGVIMSKLIDAMDEFERFFIDAPIDYDDRMTLWCEFISKILK